MAMFPVESPSASKYDRTHRISLVRVPPVHGQTMQRCECAEPDWEMPQMKIIISHCTLQAKPGFQGAAYEARTTPAMQLSNIGQAYKTAKISGDGRAN